mmetsp:Transcript_97275/g.302912  ORF Transcript_97275/g.302912 Transcript_97275/m.302912 type:complete len:253 (+) Transcript_97275:2121-2879(+)
MEPRFAGSTGSSEKKGSRPSKSRTCRASARYSKFTAAAGSVVGATRARPSPSSTKQWRPNWAEPANSCTSFRERGMCSTFHPISYSARRAFFAAAASISLASVSARRPRRVSSARHSPCASEAPSNSKSPRGRRQWRQRQSRSPSASSTTSKSSGAIGLSCRVAPPPVTRENRARRTSAVASGKAPAPGLPRSLGWNHNRAVPSTAFTPITMSSPPEASRTTCPCLKPPTSRQTSSRMSKVARGAFFSKLPA